VPTEEIVLALHRGCIDDVANSASIAQRDQFRPRNRDKIVSDLHRYGARTGRAEIPTDVLENLMVNWQALKGPLGPALAKFLVSQGVDGSVTHHGQDDWMVLYNLDKIVSYRKANSKELIDLPRLRHL